MSADAGRIMPLPKGAWNSATQYEMLDMVSYNGSMYIAKRSNTNVTPVEGADWQLASQGATGALVSSFNGRTGAVVPASGDYDLDDMGDSNISSPTNGQVLQYNGTSSKWENADFSGGILPHIIVISEHGSTVTATKGQTVISATETSSGHFELDVPEFGTWTIDAILSGDDAQVSLVVDTVKVYTVDDSHTHGDITVSFPSGGTCSCSKSGETTLYANTNPYTFVVHSLGEWTITATGNGETYTQTVNITTSGQTESLTIPNGSSVTPTDSVATLLSCAGIHDTSITTLSDLLADSTTLLAVINSNNAVDYLVRSKTFASTVCADATAMTDIGLNNYASNTLLADSDWLTAICNSTYFESVLNVKVPTMTSDTTPSGECFCSTFFPSYNPYKAFDGSTETKSRWATAENATVAGSYLGYRFTTNVKVAKATIKGYLTSVNPNVFKFQYKSNGIWTDVPNSQTTYPSNTNVNTFNYSTAVDSTEHRLYVVSGVSTSSVDITELNFYGRADI